MIKQKLRKKIDLIPAVETTPSANIIPEKKETQPIEKVILPTEIIDNVSENKNKIINEKTLKNKSGKSNIVNDDKVIKNTQSFDNTLTDKTIWNLINFVQIKQIETDIEKIQSLTISNDNKFIVTGGSDKLIKLWSVEEEKEIASFVGHKMGINAVAFSGDNKLIISGGSDKLVKLWNVEKQTEEKSIKTEFKSPITALVFHPNNQSILCFSQLDQKIGLIDLDSESELFSFRIPSQFSSLTVMNVDGSCFVSTINDKNIVIWQI